MEFRVDFYFRIVMDILFYVVEISFFKIIYGHVSTLGGWTENQSLVFISSFLLVDALHMSIFANNMWWMPFFINKGDLDYYLVRPVSSLFFLSVRDFAANSFINLLIAIGIFTWSLVNYSHGTPEAPITLNSLFLYGALILNGTFLYYVLGMFFIIPVFWIQSDRGFRDIWYQVSQLGSRPDVIFKGWVRRILTSVFPMALIVSFPSVLFFKGFEWTTLFHVLGMSLLMFCVMVFFWRRGLRSYSSASS